MRDSLSVVKHMLSQLISARNQLCREQTTDEKMLSRIEETITRKNAELKALRCKLEVLKEREERATRAKIVVEKRIYDNVEIRYESQRITAVPSGQVEIKWSKDQLVMEKLFLKHQKTA